MIRDEQEWAIARRSLDVLEAVDVHDVVGGEMDPTRAHGALTPRPESFPGAAIHPPDEAEGNANVRTGTELLSSSLTRLGRFFAGSV